VRKKRFAHPSLAYGDKKQFIRHTSKNAEQIQLCRIETLKICLYPEVDEDGGAK